MSDRLLMHVRLAARKKQREQTEEVAANFASAAPSEPSGFLA